MTFILHYGLFFCISAQCDDTADAAAAAAADDDDSAKLHYRDTGYGQPQLQPHREGFKNLTESPVRRRDLRSNKPVAVFTVGSAGSS